MHEITDSLRKEKNRKEQGRKLSYPKQLDDQLAAWISEKREESYIAVSSQMICLTALSLIRPTDPHFKASYGCLRKFMMRHNLVLRARTSIGQTLPKDLEAKIVAFHSEICSVRTNGDYPYELIANMDEMPVFLDLVPNRTVDRKGKKSIRVRTTNSEKRHIQLLFAVLQAESFYLLLSFLKEKLPEHSGVTVPSGVVATMQQKAWMDEQRMLAWTSDVWRPYVSGRPALLILDKFSAHFTDRVQEAFRQLNTKWILIPGGCTSVLQPLDISINKPFKGYIRQAWTQYMHTQSERSDVKKPPPPKSLLLTWIKAAQDMIEANQIIAKKSFLIAGLSDALGGHEDKMIRNNLTFKEVDEVKCLETKSWNILNLMEAMRITMIV